MPMKERLKAQLECVRGLSEKLLAAFQTPEDWTYQVNNNSNHALWFLGHIGIADDFFVTTFDPTLARKVPHYNELFGIGSEPVNDPAAYPPAAEMLEYWRERRQMLLAILDTLSDEDLSRPVPEKALPFWTDMASILEMAVWHESMHAGQISVVRRALGNAPLVSRPPQPA